MHRSVYEIYIYIYIAIWKLRQKTFLKFLQFGNIFNPFWLFWYPFQIAIGTDDVYKSAEVVSLVTQELGGKITRQPGPIPGLNTKITSFLDPDGWKTVRFLQF